MSRIGRKPIPVPETVSVTIEPEIAERRSDVYLSWIRSISRGVSAVGGVTSKFEM